MKQPHTRHAMRWITHSYYIDIDTAEQITAKKCRKEYIIIHKEKFTYVKRTTGYIEITNECRRNPQLTIF